MEADTPSHRTRTRTHSAWHVGLLTEPNVTYSCQPDVAPSRSCLVSHSFASSQSASRWHEDGLEEAGTETARLELWQRGYLHLS